MEVAIKYEKIELGGIKVAFKPVSVIKGNYDKEDELFTTDYGQDCESFLNYDFDSVDYFGYPVKLEDLKKRYESDDDMEVMSMYFTEFGSNYYIGYVDDNYEKINLLSMTLDQVTQMYVNALSKKDQDVQNYSEEPLITFSLEEFKKFLEIDEIDQLHSLVNQFLETFDTIEKNNVDSNNEDLEEEDISEQTNADFDEDIFEGFEDESDENLTEKKKTTDYKVGKGNLKKTTDYKLDKEESKKMISLKDLRTDIKASIIGQDKAVDDVARQIIINMTSKNYRNKSHIFITGPSGTGKTEIVSLIANRLGLPVFKANATEYSKSGYIGKETNSMLAGLISAAGGDVKKAEKGFLIIDEMDKVVLGSSLNKNFDKAIIFALLKMMDRDVVEVDMDHYNSKLFDTSNLTIIFMGAFSEYLKEKQKYQEKPMGFIQTNSSTNVQKCRITEEDLIKNFGAEFVGRLGRITSTDELQLEDVIKILYESKISQYKVIKEDLLNRGVELESDDEFIMEVAKQGYSKETGVRSLNKVVKEKFDYIYDEILTNEKVKTLKLTKETALDPKKYYAE